MADAVDVRALHRREHALGRVLVEARVHEAITQSSCSSSSSATSSSPFARMFTSIPFRIRNGRQHLVQRVDLLPLQSQPAVAQARRVVAHREVLVPQRLRGARHLLDRRLSIRPGRVRVQVAAQVAALDQDRQRTVAGSSELAAVLAQLGRDVRVAKVRVELLLVGGLELLAGLRVRDRVLRDGEAPANGVFAQGDVVVLRAGEVLQQVPVRLGWHHPKVEPEPLVRDHSRLRVALRDDRGDVLSAR